jgi:hypothetical protein
LAHGLVELSFIPLPASRLGADPHPRAKSH